MRTLPPEELSFVGGDGRCRLDPRLWRDTLRNFTHSATANLAMRGEREAPEPALRQFRKQRYRATGEKPALAYSPLGRRAPCLGNVPSSAMPCRGPFAW